MLNFSLEIIKFILRHEFLNILKSNFEIYAPNRRSKNQF